MGSSSSTNGEKRNAYMIRVGKPAGKTPLGRRRRRFVGNIKMDIRDVGWDGMDLTELGLRIGTSGGLL
jgi:hypothetical protein